MRFYIHGEGGIWRVSHRAIRSWRPESEGGTYVLSMPGVRELAAERNYQTGRWRGLPEGIYDTMDGRLGATGDVEIASYGDIDEMLPLWREGLS